MRITGSWVCASERGRSGDSVYRFSVAGVSNIQSMTDPVLSNMDVATSSCEGLGSDSLVLSEVLEDNLKPHMGNSNFVQTYPGPSLCKTPVVPSLIQAPLVSW